MKKSYYILYRNHSVKKYKESKFLSNLYKLDMKKIKMILVPCDEHPNLYIPIKPSSLLIFEKAEIHIQYAICQEIFESNEYYDLELYNYGLATRDFRSFINGLFNVYKFRGASIVISEVNEAVMEGSDYGYSIYPIKIKYSLYDSNDRIFHESSTGNMGSLRKDIKDLPSQYSFENRFKILDDIFYIPSRVDYHAREPDIDGLPSIINLYDGKHWNKVNHIDRETSDIDLLAIKLIEFLCYYIIDASYVDKIEKYILRSETIQVIVCDQKESDDEYPGFCIKLDFTLNSTAYYLQVYSLFKCILNYAQFIYSRVFMDLQLTPRVFVKFIDNHLFSPEELTPKVVEKNFIDILLRRNEK